MSTAPESLVYMKQHLGLFDVCYVITDEIINMIFLFICIVVTTTVMLKKLRIKVRKTDVGKLFQVGVDHETVTRE